MDFMKGLLENAQSPLFLGGLGMMDSGFQGMQQGMQAGAAFQDRARKAKQQEQFNQGLMHIPGLDDNTRSLLAANPELGQQVVGRMIADKTDPMSDIRRRTAEAGLQQTTLENSLFPLKQKQIESQIAQVGRGGDMPSSVREWEYFNKLPLEQQQKYLNMKRQDKVLDLGTSYARMNPVDPNAPMVSYQKDIAGKEREQKVGEAQGSAAASLPVVEVSADRLLAAIDRVSGSKNLPNVTGMVGGRIPRNMQGEGQSEVQADIDQIGGSTFLQAYNDLRGGGPIAVAESQAAKEAYNTLQTQTMGTEGYRAALKRFRGEVEKLRVVARQKAAGTAGQSPSAGGWQTLPGGIRIREKR